MNAKPQTHRSLTATGAPSPLSFSVVRGWGPLRPPPKGWVQVAGCGGAHTPSPWQASSQTPGTLALFSCVNKQGGAMPADEARQVALRWFSLLIRAAFVIRLQTDLSSNLDLPKSDVRCNFIHTPLPRSVTAGANPPVPPGAPGARGSLGVFYLH